MIGLEEVYDAAFDRERFPALIERLVRLFGAQSGFFGWSDMDSVAGFQAQYGNDPRWLQAYVETYAAHDILQPVLHAVPEGVCARAYPVLQQLEVRDSIFYREFLAPQRIVDNLAVNLIKRPGIVAHLALIRVEPAAPFSIEDCDRLSALLPHLRRAVYIQSHLVRAADHAASDRSTSGTGSRAILLMADQTIAEIDPELATRLRLQRGEPVGDGAIGTMIQRAIDRQEPVAMELPRADGAPLPLLCEVRILDQNRFGDIASEQAAAYAVYFTMLDEPRSIAFDAIGELFRLTPTELKVLREAIEHGDLIGIGERLGMARATARTHLHRIYDKTATRGIASLSSLAHRFGRRSAG